MTRSIGIDGDGDLVMTEREITRKGSAVHIALRGVVLGNVLKEGQQPTQAAKSDTKAPKDPVVTKVPPGVQVEQCRAKYAINSNRKLRLSSNDRPLMMMGAADAAVAAAASAAAAAVLSSGRLGRC